MGAGTGTDDSGSKTYYCGENKVPVAKQKDQPSGSDSVGSGQKSKCCAAACSTVTYKAGEGTNAGTSYCCAATCASTKWAAGKKPKSPASGTMYCGDGMSPKAALADTVCAGDDCVEATDAGTCCEKTKVSNTTATTDAHSTGASVLLLSGALVLAAQ